MTTRLLLTTLLLFSTAVRASAAGCRTDVLGLPFQVPAAIVRSMQIDSLYAPTSFEDSRIPSWVRKHLLQGGKRLRPAMVYLAAMAHQRTPESVRELAGVVELIHLGSLVLDDFIDKADKRRDRDALHKAEGEVAGVVTGPWLQAYVARKLALMSTPAVIVHESETLMRMGDAEIQQADLKSRATSRGRYTELEYNKVALGKTGHLFGLAFSIGSLHFGDSSEITEKWISLGKQMGLAYQIKDDFDDVLKEPGEINFFHLMRSFRCGGSPFDPTLPPQLEPLRKEYIRMITERRSGMMSTLEFLRQAVPSPLTDEQNAAFDTLKDMVVALSEP